jgi:hypothetical protein
VTFGDIRDHRKRELKKKPAWSWTVPTWLAAKDPIVTTPTSGLTVATGPGERVTLAGVQEQGGKSVTVVFTADDYQGDWKALGGPLDPQGSILPSLLIGKDGAPVVAFVDHDFNVRAQRWSGSTWQDLGSTPVGKIARYSYDGVSPPSMAMDGKGQLYITYQINYPEAPDRVYAQVMMFSQGAWSQLGDGVGGNTTCQNAYKPSIAVAKEGAPLVTVAYTDINACVAYLYQGKWNQYVSKLNADGETSRRLVISLDEGGSTFAFGSFGTAGDMKYKLFHLTSSAWVGIGAPIATTTTEPDPPFLAKARYGHLFAFVGGSAPLSFQAADVTAASWTRIAAPVQPPTQSPAAAAASSIDGFPVIAWWADDAKVVRVRRLNQ